MGTREVLAKEVGLKELYQVDNPYKKRLQAMYEAYKSSDDYKDSKLTEEDYLFASHQTRAFTYHSLNDEKAAFEGKRDLLLVAGVVILTIFCPPAGAVASVALASSDMYSAAVGYVIDLAKTGKLASKTALKTSLKETLQEGFEQDSRNIDNFKTVLKNVDEFGKRVVTKIDDFGKQTTEILRTIRDEAYQLADGVFNLDFSKHTAKVYMPSSQIDEGLEASRRFTLNGGGSKIRVPNSLT